MKAPAASAAGAEISVRDTTRNAGVGGSGPTTTRLWLSANKTVGIGDVDLGSRIVPALAAGAQHVATTTVSMPTVAPGAYYVLAQADADNDAAESNEDDNVKAKAILLGPDLTIKSMVFSPSSPTSSAPVTITLTIDNLGGATALASTTRLYRSANGKLDGTDLLLAELPLGPVVAGGTASQSTSLTLPAGTYYVLAIADAANTVAEARETNNMKKTQKTIS
jgi:subtilase family serine protease